MNYNTNGLNHSVLQFKQTKHLSILKVEKPLLVSKYNIDSATRCV